MENHQNEEKKVNYLKKDITGVAVLSVVFLIIIFSLYFFDLKYNFITDLSLKLNNYLLSI